MGICKRYYGDRKSAPPRLAVADPRVIARERRGRDGESRGRDIPEIDRAAGPSVQGLLRFEDRPN